MKKIFILFAILTLFVLSSCQIDETVYHNRNPKIGIPVFNAAEEISVSSPNCFGWFITVYPNGSVNAQFGSLPGDNIVWSKGTVNFKKLYMTIVTKANIHKEEKDLIDFHISGKDIHDPDGIYLKRIDIPKDLLGIESNNDWEAGYNGAKRMKDILSKNPITF